MRNKERQLYEFGPFRMDPDHRLLLREGKPVPLQSKAFDVLLVLIQNGEKVVAKDDLMKAVWPETFVEESNLSQHIFALRKALGDAVGLNRYIVTVPGRGYRFAERVQVIGDGEALEDEQLIVESHTRSRLVMEGQPMPIPALPGRSRRMRGLIALSGLLALIVAAAIAVYLRRGPQLTEKDTLVLADFDNKTGDPVFSDALRQALSAQLEQSPFLNLLPDQRVAQTLALMTQPKDARLTHDLALEVCRRTASAAVLDASITQLGERYLLTLKAINCTGGGETLASTEAQATDKNHVLDALGESAAEIRRKLGESLASVQKYSAPPEDVTTPSLEALQSYSLGYRTMIAKNDRPAAIPLFQRAISLDPSFAMAYARLGITFYNMDEPSRAEQNLRKAYDLRERLSQREKLYVAASYAAMAKGNMEAARKSYEMWQQIYPRDQFAVGNLGVVYGYLGNYDKALIAMQEAWKLNPGNALVFSNIVGAYSQLNRLDDAIAFASKAKELHLESMALHSNLYLVAFLRHDAGGMEREAAELKGKPGWEDLILDHESDTAAYDGHFSRARDLTRRAIDSAIRSDKKETAAAYEGVSAVREALVGNLALAEQQANSALALSRGEEAEAFAAIACALAGDSSQAARLADDLNQHFPEQTSVQFNFLPNIRAAAELKSGNSARAEEALTVAQPYELGETTPEVSFDLYPVYFRGQSFLAEKKGDAAITEFQKIVAHPGLVVNEVIGALAHLGMARAYTLASNSGKAKAEYEQFLSLWKDADADIPILKQAKTEYAKLH